jgi:hypothetical protein
VNFPFHPEADEAFLAAVAYYEDCEPGLGLDFARAVSTSIRNALDYPRMWPEIEAELRRSIVHRFRTRCCTVSNQTGSSSWR